MMWFFDFNHPKRVFWIVVPLLTIAFGLLLWQAIIMARIRHDRFYLWTLGAGILILACHPVTRLFLKAIRSQSETAGGT